MRDNSKIAKFFGVSKEFGYLVLSGLEDKENANLSFVLDRLALTVSIKTYSFDYSFE